MDSRPTGSSRPSLLGMEIRRSFWMGRVFLAVSFAYTLLFQTILILAGSGAFDTTVPLLLPIFSVVGAMGSLSVYSSDRIKGVFEYLMAYGFTPQRLFLDVLLAGLTMVSLVVGVSLAFGVGLYVATGHTVSATLVELLVIYTIPMSYASVAFATTVGMYWTSLSSPRAGMNSPVGIVPFIGIAPSLLTLAALGLVHAPAAAILGLAVLLVTVTVVVLLRSIGRLLPRERLLSPA